MKNCTSVLESQAVLTLRTITNGSEYMYRKPSEMHIGNIFPISSPLKLMTMIPIAREKNEKCKRFWSFVKSLKEDASGVTSLREKKVQVGKDQEKAQSEKDSHSKNQGGKKPN